MLYLTRKQLINLQFNIGHNKGKWLKFLDFSLYGIRNSLIIFNLDFSVFILRKIAKYIVNVSSLRGRLFFISSFLNSNNVGLSQYVLRKFFNLHGFYDGSFLGGLISNLKLFLKLKRLHKKKVHIILEIYIKCIQV